MSVPMKKRPTKEGPILKITHKGTLYRIPKSVAEKYRVAKPKVSPDVKKSDSAKSDSILADDLFAELDQKFTKPGALLQGLRHRESMSQIEFANKINVSQSDLSKMEHGKRPIGKVVAKRIAQQFGIDYRMLLG